MKALQQYFDIALFVQQTTSSPPFFLRYSKKSETRARVKMVPLSRRIYSILLVCFMILQNEISDFLSIWMLTKLKAELSQVFEAHFQHVFHLHSSQYQLIELIYDLTNFIMTQLSNKCLIFRSLIKLLRKFKRTRFSHSNFCSNGVMKLQCIFAFSLTFKNVIKGFSLFGCERSLES